MITLATLEKATKQEVLDQVVDHLRTQNAKSRFISSNSPNMELYCMYHNPNGLKCAAGCLIADNEYHHSFEGRTWIALVIMQNFTANHQILISDLQSVHDSFTIEDWEKRFEEIAEQYKLILKPK